ncbi:hypothetical protein NDU88_010734 [Pleurodeles waltl]|uniref:Uncharacterized protein n=1 Tax=Pleurodeles waltl TaxID=8319 RepID=A0AAV7PWE7_PLEWA|nr:hypothetical protein NDU88_010734 [Pleurodeles waltl]
MALHGQSTDSSGRRWRRPGIVPLLTKQDADPGYQGGQAGNTTVGPEVGWEHSQVLDRKSVESPTICPAQDAEEAGAGVNPLQYRPTGPTCRGGSRIRTSAVRTGEDALGLTGACRAGRDQ